MEPFILKKYRQYSKPELKVPYKYKTQGTFFVAHNNEKQCKWQ